MKMHADFKAFQAEVEAKARNASDKTLLHNMRLCLKRRYLNGSDFYGRNMTIMDACHRAYQAKRRMTKSAALDRIKQPWELGVDFDQYGRYLTLNADLRSEYLRQLFFWFKLIEQCSSGLWNCYCIRS